MGEYTRGKHERRQGDEFSPGDYENPIDWESSGMAMTSERASEIGQRIGSYFAGRTEDSSRRMGERIDLSMDGGEWSRPWESAFMRSETPSGSENENGGHESIDRKRDRRGNLGEKLRKFTALALVIAGTAMPSWGGGGEDDGSGANGEVANPVPVATETYGAPIIEMPDGRLVQNGMLIKGSEPGKETIAVEASETNGSAEQMVGSIDAVGNAESEAIINSNEGAGTGIVIEEVKMPEVENERMAKFDVIGQKDIDGLGVIDKYKYSGGYIRENDPYYVNFENKSTEDSFGAPLEGASPAERVQDLTKRWATSPKELVAMISHMNLESEMGIAEFKSMDEENAFADALAGYDDEKYDDFVNRFYALFYGKVAKAKLSKNSIMARDMKDQTGDPSDGEQSEIKMFAQLRGNEGAVQVTFFGKDGKNVISDKEAFNHEFETMSKAEQDKANGAKLVVELGLILVRKVEKKAVQGTSNIKQARRPKSQLRNQKSQLRNQKSQLRNQKSQLRNRLLSLRKNRPLSLRKNQLLSLLRNRPLSLRKNRPLSLRKNQLLSLRKNQLLLLPKNQLLNRLQLLQRNQLRIRRQ
ncbi:hypothetical protein IKG06_02730 [Candidatus Saccharibacteria bacterium]|nr:hypothetical protein [Candidatus Saccharibacteria bacterium]